MNHYPVALSSRTFTRVKSNGESVTLTGPGGKLDLYLEQERLVLDGEEVARGGEMWNLLCDEMGTIVQAQPDARPHLKLLLAYLGLEEADRAYVLPSAPTYRPRLKEEGVLRHLYEHPVLTWNSRDAYGAKCRRSSGSVSAGVEAPRTISQDLRQLIGGAQEKVPPDKRWEPVFERKGNRLSMDATTHRLYREMMDYLHDTYGFQF